VPKKFQNRHSNPLNFDKKVFPPLSTSQKHAQNPLKIQGKSHSFSSKKFKTSLLLHGGFALNKKPALSYKKPCLPHQQKKSI
jgi:hypothetical protein